MLKIVEINSDVANLVQQNDGFCPCSVVQNNDTLCPCKAFRDQSYAGECHCGRYEKVLVADRRSEYWDNVVNV